MGINIVKQVKELGVLVTSCKSLIEDALKIVGVYIYAAINNRLPTVWPREFRTKFNKDRPLDIKLNGTDSKVYLTVPVSVLLSLHVIPMAA